MNKHEMHDCVIKRQQTLGIVKPKTYGGYNGDISRKHFLGINEKDRLKTNLINYIKAVKIHNKIPFGRVGFMDRKYLSKHSRFFNIKENINFKKFDEVVSKLCFNLEVYMQATNKETGFVIMTEEERQNLYYKDLIVSLRAQIKKK